MAGIIVAFPKEEDARKIKNLLVRNGFSVSSVCTTGAQAIGLADSYSQGIVICGYRLPDLKCCLWHPDIYLPNVWITVLFAWLCR